MVGLLRPSEHRGAVELSWERCLRYRLEAQTRHPILRVLQSELAPRREALADALGDIRTEIDALCEIALRAGHCLLVTDQDCIIVDTRVASSEQEVFDETGIATGSCLNEQIAGTNGTALALSEGRLFTARGCDHYFRELKILSCSGVPLRSAAGDIMGVLTLCCIDREQAGDYVLAQHLLGQTADKIEGRLFARAHSDHHLMPPGLHAPPGALLALDDDSKIVAATRAAAALAPDGCESFVGRPYEEVFATAPPAHIAPGRTLKLGTASGRLPPGLREISGNDPTAHRAAAKAEQLFAAGLPILVLGAAGTGKHRFAQALLATRYNRTRSLDCAALTAVGDAADRFSQWAADTDCAVANGTACGVLIDQINLLPSEANKRLLAWLLCHDRNKTLHGPGSRMAIVATSSDTSLPSGFEPIFASRQVILPTLAERNDLADVINMRYQRLPGAAGAIATDVMARLTSYDWPGNLYELDAILSQALAASVSGRIGLAHLPNHVGPAPACAAQTTPGLEEALAQTHWNVSRAAQLMGISRATINRRIKEAGLTRPAVTKS